MSVNCAVAESNVSVKPIIRCVNIVFLFLYVFQPAFFKISIIHILTFYMVMFILYNSFAKAGGKLVLDNRSNKSLYAFLPFIIYVTFDYLIQSVISVHSSLILHNLLIFYLVLFRIMLSIEYLRHLFRYYEYSFKDLANDFITVAFLQLICVIIAFANPEIRTFFNNLTLIGTDSVYIQDALLNCPWRSYGLAGNLFDAFGYTTSLLIVLTFAMGIDRQNMKLIILSGIMFLMPLLNTRTGIILAMGGIIIIFFLYKKNITASSLSKCFWVIVILSLIMWELYYILPEETKSWIEVGFFSTKQLMNSGETVGVYEVILHDNFKFPDNLLFGAAVDPGDILNTGIESGYIQCLWQFGVFGTMLLFIGFTYFLGYCFFTLKRSIFRAIVASYGAIFFVYLIKLFSVFNVSANIMLIGFPIIFLFIENKKIKR